MRFWEDAVTLGGMGFSAHFGQRDGGWFPVNRLCGRYFSRRLEFSRVSNTDTPVAAHRSGSKSTTSPGSRRLRNGTSFPHDARATLADRGEHVQHGGADLQENLPAVAHDLARGLKQPPPHGLRLRALPSASKGMRAKAEIQIVGQYPDGEEDRVGLERTQGMYSMPKPTFKSLIRFSLASPRCEYHPIVTAASSFGRLLAMA
jgi:hypothetical protein